MAKILNVDSLVPAPQRALSIGGTEHPIAELTVENYIESTRDAQQLEGSTDQMLHLEVTIKMILRFVPTLTREQLVRLPLDTLKDIVAFVRGDDEDETPEPAAEVAQGEAGK